ncbi:uncharacterized protein LY89DRAFT_709912 [Mollisia scopiformis]|uniref:Uncharacterized protein n=1 Tax=Mollisia scopiformis TaxID=149040 RepID=A0A194WVP8_MOLSC|nr:uncharacterized protein LY89DRAFT_709912 [Mollisia scopiformis]KUJ12046.1 hypothetical protein LY89DRAFT_709912 [Mollisia scopiformis]
MSSPKSKPKQLREPPPSLFLGPPSQNASHVSLPGVVPAAAPNTSLIPSRAPLIRQRSQLGPQLPSRAMDGPTSDSASVNVTRAAALPRQLHDAEGKKQADRTDALWAEMQSTLEEVELSAVSGTHVFGQEHARALEGLRAAQIELAQAWARSEADDVVENADRESKGLSGSRGVGALGSEGRSVLDATGASTVPSGSGRPGSSGNAAVSGTEAVGTQLEEETEADILLARKRREANDRYFQRVNEGVLDVVAKLEEVAKAMKAVEQESRDIWGENETASARTSYHE